ncbi:unnamed protein product, partial [Timema podura]|nr:unnamed protein product [Timema podura]
SQKQQRLTTFLDKLSAIQHILNTVVNIRDRDIRHKYPFTKEAVRLLRFTRPTETKR